MTPKSAKKHIKKEFNLLRGASMKKNIDDSGKNEREI